SLTAYKVCCIDTNTLFEENSFALGSNIRPLKRPKIKEIQCLTGQKFVPIDPKTSKNQRNLIFDQ
uniref:Uncharacterized protein n=1 Tax=Romanomermis culicivorax TaxID=13658 RepID=A0A915KDE0_ROMCU